MKNELLIFYLRKILRLNSAQKIIDFSVRRHKNKIFLIEPDKNKTLTFKEFDQESSKLSNELKGDIHFYSAQNSIEYFLTRTACYKAGTIFFGLSPNLTQETKNYFINKANALKGSTELSGISTLNLSSGTTQKIPKIIKLSEQNWIESLYNYVLNSNTAINEKVIFLSTLPFTTAGSTTFLPAILAGITYIIIKEDSPASKIAENIQKYSVNRLYTTPFRLLELMDWCKDNNTELKSLKAIIIGTERMPKQMFTEAINFFGPIIQEGYGMAEALPPISLCGKIAKNVSVKLIDDGRIAVKSKTVSAGYLDNPEENKRSFVNGWFYSNDWGRVENGFLYFYGRYDDIITNTPKRIFASEIEDKIYSLELVKNCILLKKEERTYAFITIKNNAEKEAAMEQILKLLQNEFAQIKISLILKESLPLNFAGKIDRNLLKAEAA